MVVRAGINREERAWATSGSPPGDDVEFRCSDGVVRTWGEMSEAASPGTRYRAKWAFELITEFYGAEPVDPHAGWGSWRGPRFRLVECVSSRGIEQENHLFLSSVSTVLSMRF